MKHVSNFSENLSFWQKSRNNLKRITSAIIFKPKPNHQLKGRDSQPVYLKKCHLNSHSYVFVLVKKFILLLVSFHFCFICTISVFSFNLFFFFFYYQVKNQCVCISQDLRLVAKIVANFCCCSHLYIVLNLDIILEDNI